MKFGLTHGPLEAKQETIIVAPRIVDALFVNDEGVSESTDLQKVIPVATGASEAGDFQTQDRSAVLEPHFSHQRLKPIPPNGRRARVSLILINDMNVLSCPSQAESTLHQVVLAHGTGRVVAHLHQRGLAYIDQRIAIQMVKLDLAQCWISSHQLSPYSPVHQASLGQARHELLVVRRVGQ